MRLQNPPMRITLVLQTSKIVASSHRITQWQIPEENPVLGLLLYRYLR
jgi:hypothetical protein